MKWFATVILLALSATFHVASLIGYCHAAMRPVAVPETSPSQTPQATSDEKSRKTRPPVETQSAHLAIQDEIVGGW